MTKRKADNRFQIPAVIDPPASYCVTIPVPDDPLHWAAFWGALHELTQGMSWADDGAHSAKQLIQVWQKVLEQAQLSTCQTPNVLHGTEIEELMPLRIDCECNVFVTCCDGTEKQILTSDQVKAIVAGGSTQGAPQPPAGGGCQSYNGVISQGAPFLVPVPVSTGDTIEITASSGATQRSGDIGWYCPDGTEFFAGACVGSPTYDGADPVPSAPRSSIILHLNAVDYSLLTGPFTVPGGISNLQPTVMLNYVSGAPIYGDLTITVRVCNNASAPWTKTWNFALTPGPFAPKDGNRAVWVAGVGWTPGAITQVQLTTAGMITMPAGVFFDEVDFALSLGGTAELAFFDGASYHFDDAGVASPHPYAHPVTAGWAFEPGGYSGADTFQSLTIKGHGVNPF